MNVTKIEKVSEIGIIKDKTYGKKSSDFKKFLAKESLAKNQGKDDSVSISDDARTLLCESEMARMLDQLRESSDPGNNPYMDKIKCLEIAMRIISGDHVPPKDKQFLMEHEPELFMRAQLLKRQKDNPKKYKSLLEGEKVDITDNIHVSTSAPSPASSPAEGESPDGESSDE